MLVINTKRRSVLLYIFLYVCQGCSFIPERSYSDIMDETEDFYVPERDFVLTSGDSGNRYISYEQTLDRTPAAFNENDNSVSPELREKYQLQKELAVLEQTQPPMFLEMYWQFKEDFNNDSERIYFLSLPSLKEREMYLSSKGMKSHDNKPKYVSELISKEDHREILSGMSAIQVRKIAGNPSYSETTGIDGSTRWAYRLPNYRVRYIYFDQGIVKGWSEEVSP
jgi:hypothetical protein